MSKLLVTGGAGYIGSFMVKALIDRGDDVTVLDNLERGHKEAVDFRASFVNLDIKDEAGLHDLFSKNRFEAIIHFAGLISVEESGREPEMYYQNNVVGSRILFTNARESGIKKFIFSSTAAVYGNPIQVPIPEDHPKNPTSPYGETKLETEKTLAEIRASDPDVSFACLRYFNACGASIDGSMGESHDPETHIIPMAMRAALSGDVFKLFGTDYDTFDGTCVRDYIHVLDLVEAHKLALDKLSQKDGYIYNVGTGNGFSNRQIIEMVERVTSKRLSIVEEKRRQGDADQLIADPSKINNDLGFSPKHSDLETIVRSAWEWHNK